MSRESRYWRIHGRPDEPKEERASDKVELEAVAKDIERVAMAVAENATSEAVEPLEAESKASVEAEDQDEQGQE